MNERELILDCLIEILEKGAYTDRTLSDLLFKYDYLDKHTKSLISREITGVVENRILLDEIVNLESKTKVKKMKPLIRNLLRMSVYEMYFMNSIKNHAVVNEAVKLAKKRGFSGLSGFVNGVLRSVLRRKETLPENEKFPISDDRIVNSIPEAVAKVLKESTGDKLVEISEAMMAQSKITIRVNTNLITEDELATELENQGANVSKVCLKDVLGKEISALSVEGLGNLEKNSEFIKGRFYIQDLSSMAVAVVADPKEGDKVIDVCAAPGGKATHIAQLLNGTGMVDARDLTEYKVSFIEENKTRLNLSNLTAKAFDATKLDESAVDSADIVIADLPCSGLGVIGKKPDIKYNFTIEKGLELAKLQAEILDKVCQYVKVGGKLVFSTCTINKAENEDNANSFIKRHPEFVATGMQQILPQKDVENDGFFIATFERRKNE